MVPSWQWMRLREKLEIRCETCKRSERLSCYDGENRANCNVRGKQRFSGLRLKDEGNAQYAFYTCNHFACQILLHQHSRHYRETILNDTVCSDLRQHPHHHHHLCNGARPLWNMARFSSTLHSFGLNIALPLLQCAKIYISVFSFDFYVCWHPYLD